MNRREFFALVGGVTLAGMVVGQGKRPPMRRHEIRSIALTPQEFDRFNQEMGRRKRSGPMDEKEYRDLLKRIGAPSPDTRSFRVTDEDLQTLERARPVSGGRIGLAGFVIIVIVIYILGKKVMKYIKVNKGAFHSPYSESEEYQDAFGSTAGRRRTYLRDPQGRLYLSPM